MSQVVDIISRACIVIVLVIISVIIGEVFNSTKRIQHFLDNKLKERSNRLLEKEKFKRDVLNQIVQGIVFCIFIFIDSISIPIVLGEVTYGARPIFLSLAVVHGPITVTITSVFAIISRTFIIGGKFLIGVWGIAAIYTFEMALLFYLKAKKKELNEKNFGLLSVVANIITSFTVFAASGADWHDVLVPLLTFTVVYPIATIIAYKIMVYVEGSRRILDELSLRDEELNKANRELKELIEELRETEVHFRTMFYHSSEAILLIENQKIVDVNNVGLKLLGCKKDEEVIGRDFSDFIIKVNAEDEAAVDGVDRIFDEVKQGKTLKREVQVKKGDGTEIAAELFLTELRMAEQKYIYISARDVSARKRREEEILFRARYDEITKVANRKYFNEVVENTCANQDKYPIGYLMADINGLKLTNDVFGHIKGDELIVKIANALKQSCRSNDLAARIGGDEFAILFTNTDERTMESVMERIRQKLYNEPYDTVKPSVALGYAIKYSKDEGVEFSEIIRLADERMYANKASMREENKKIFLGNMVSKLYEISPKEIEQKKELSEMLSKVKNVMNIDASTERKLEQLINYINIGKLITPRADWEMKGASLAELKFSEKLLRNTGTIFDIISHSENSIISNEELLGINKGWCEKSEEGLVCGSDLPVAVRIFKIMFDIYYLRTHKEIVGVLSKEEIVRLIKSEEGKRYDPELCRYDLGEIF